MTNFVSHKRGERNLPPYRLSDRRKKQRHVAYAAVLERSRSFSEKLLFTSAATSGGLSHWFNLETTTIALMMSWVRPISVQGALLLKKMSSATIVERVLRHYAVGLMVKG